MRKQRGGRMFQEQSFNEKERNENKKSSSIPDFLNPFEWA
jgi:hypothetical protein